MLQLDFDAEYALNSIVCRAPLRLSRGLLPHQYSTPRLKPVQAQYITKNASTAVKTPVQAECRLINYQYST